MIKTIIAAFGFLSVLFSIADYETPAFDDYHVSDTNKSTNYVTIGEQIKEARLAKNMSMEELAKRSELTMRQLKNVEAGKAEPVKDVLVNIERILEASFIYGGYYHIP